MPQPEGMLTGGASPGRSPYNGEIKVENDIVPVKDGVLTYEGNTMFVSDDGMMVVTPERALIGYIENGELKETNPAHEEMLRQKGVLEQ